MRLKFFLQNEPNVKDFVKIGNLTRRINVIDPVHFCYTKLFPNYADTIQSGTKEYRTYVSKFPSHLSEERERCKSHE